MRQESQCQRYPMRTPKDLTSHYDQYMHQRQLACVKIEQDRLENDEQRQRSVRTVHILYIYIYVSHRSNSK
jgi:hypothetical protein